MQVFADHLLDAWVVSLSYTPDFYYYHYYIIIIIIIIIVIIIIILLLLLSLPFYLLLTLK